MPAMRPASLDRPRHALRPTLMIAALLAALLPGLAAAQVPSRARTPVQTEVDEYTQVQRLTGARQYGEAIQRANAYIEKNPRDPQMRFLKSVALSEASQPDAAIDVLENLTQEYPELAEPHNNLAVLYAGRGQYERARLALEAALRVNPGYATARENLGDIYARLASQQYAAAAQTDRSNPRLAPKQAAIAQMLGSGAAPARAASAPARATTQPNPKPAAGR